MSEDTLNVRLYKRMLEAIDDYKNKNLGLRQLISNLEGLHNLLEHPHENWTNDFYRGWMPLEEVYAVALDRKKSELDEHSQSTIKGALEKLEELIKSELASL
jgi:hypothetical protein